MTDDRLDDRCLNWADCYRDRMRRSQALSLEGAYRSRQAEHWEYGAAPPVERPGMDWRDAEIINNAWQAIPDAFHQIILGGWYIRRWSPVRCVREGKEQMGEKCERMKEFPEDEFARILEIAHGLLYSQLIIPAVLRRQRLKARVLAALGLDEWRRMEAALQGA